VFFAHFFNYCLHSLFSTDYFMGHLICTIVIILQCYQSSLFAMTTRWGGGLLILDSLRACVHIPGDRWRWWYFYGQHAEHVAVKVKNWLKKSHKWVERSQTQDSWISCPTSYPLSTPCSTTPLRVLEIYSGFVLLDNGPFWSGPFFVNLGTGYVLYSRIVVSSFFD
jgi:hypothetical protein